MKFTFNLDKNMSESLIGELLRNEFFDQSNGARGCYSTFDLREGVEKLPDEPVDPVEDDYYASVPDLVYYVYEKMVDGQKIIMKYYWDGDGTLEFHFEDGEVLANDDCKKDYCWFWVTDKDWDR